jgi:hypothetical protein
VPRSGYYHRQADLCMRMALLASTREERIRLVEQANAYRHKASQAELLPSWHDTLLTTAGATHLGLRTGKL